MAHGLGRYGLVPRGSFVFDPSDARPDGPNGKPARSILLVGHAGGAIWPHFKAWCEAQEKIPPDPLDCWSREAIGTVAEMFGARAVFPFEKPYWPFQQWAQRAEGLKASPLGMLIHPQYGLWHAWRGALVFDHEVAAGGRDQLAHPCDACAQKPCLAACPVGAFSESGYAVGACSSHLESGISPNCLNLGCRARDACPVGRQYRYGAEQIRFHMAAFAGSGR
jgi:hypothetical protein